MENRPEDTPKVIALSAAIITVFGIIVWQRLHTPDAAGSTATQAQAPAAPIVQPAVKPTPDVVIPGQMRLLTDTALDSPPDQQTNAELPTDAFRPLNEQAGSAAHVNLPFGTLIPGLSGAVAARNALPTPKPSVPGITVVLDGVLTDDQGIEAVCSVHDPKIKDPELADRTVTLHVGDLLGGRLITEINTPGLRLQGSDLWPIGEQHILADARVIFRQPPLGVRAGQTKTKIANAAGVTSPDQPTEAHHPLATPPEQPDETDDAANNH